MGKKEDLKKAKKKKAMKKNSSSKKDEYVKKNKWMIASGVLSMIFGTICVLAMIILGFLFLSNKEYLLELAAQNQIDFESKKLEFILCCVIVSFVGLMSICIGYKIRSFGFLDSIQTKEHSADIIGVSVLQILFGGTIFVVLTIIGYFHGVSADYGVIYYNRIDNGKTKERRLKEAQDLYDNDLIDYDEYMKTRSQILAEDDGDYIPNKIF